MGKIKLKLPVIVEGKYDKAHLSSVIDAVIIPTNGFGVFKNEEKRALIRTLGKNGIITLCDSDGGGKVIRSHLRGMLGGIRVYDLYTPQIAGKERRKSRKKRTRTGPRQLRKKTDVPSRQKPKNLPGQLQEQRERHGGFCGCRRHRNRLRWYKRWFPCCPS